jgi:predicted permease
MKRLRPGIRRLFRLRSRREDIASEVDDEIRLHLELRTRQLMDSGVPEAEARTQAAHRFGELRGAREQLEKLAHTREARMSAREWVISWQQDVRYSIRSLLRDPMFSAMVIFTLALGIGANAAMFGIVDRLLLRGPAFVDDPDRVVNLFVTTHPAGRGDFTGGTVGYVMYEMLRDRTSVFEHVAAWTLRDGRVGSGEDAREVRFAYATEDLFPLLGTTPQRGRFFGEDEDRPGAASRVVVLNESYWRTHYGGDPDVIGSEIIINDASHSVIGVTPAGFTGPQLEPVAFWLPMSTHPPTASDWRTTWDAQWLRVVARLAPGVTPEQAGAAATAAYAGSYDNDDPVSAAARLTFRPLHFTEAGTEPGEMRVALWLLGVSAIVLLIACANVANLMLARGLRRGREIGVRVALGIHPRRLLRLVLTESILLAFFGGMLALLVAHWGGHAMRAFLLPNVDWTEPPLSLRILLFSGVIALTLGVALGILPALQALRQKLTATLNTGAREGGGRRSRMRMGLTVAQTALSVVLLVGAGLFVRSLANVRGLDLGLEPDRVVVLGLSLPFMGQMNSEERAAETVRRGQMFSRVLDHVRNMPDMEDAAVAVGTPFRSWFTVRLQVPGRDSIPRLPGGGPYISAVTSGYFSTVGTRILRGRAFTDADRAGSEPVLIVNETMASTLWPDEDAVGKCLLIGRDAPDCTRVVGVAEPARRSGIREEASMQYYIPFGQERGIGGNTLLVRPRPGATGVVENLRREIHALEPSVRYVSATTLQELLDPQLRQWKLGATMFALFGGLALLIAAVGLYSVIAYAVARRRCELGIRMALGARPVDITRMVVADGVGLVAAGLLIGIALSLAVGRWVEALLFDVTPRDPSTFVAVAATLLFVALAATLIPARRAGRVNPTEALRAD